MHSPIFFARWILFSIVLEKTAHCKSCLSFSCFPFPSTLPHMLWRVLTLMYSAQPVLKSISVVLNRCWWISIALSYPGYSVFSCWDKKLSGGRKRKLFALIVQWKNKEIPQNLTFLCNKTLWLKFLSRILKIGKLHWDQCTALNQTYELVKKWHSQSYRACSELDHGFYRTKEPKKP